MKHELPADIGRWLVEATGCVIENYQPHLGGGASRQGAFLTLRASNGACQACYLTYDLRAASASERLAGIVAEASALREVAVSTQMKVPKLICFSEPLRAMLTQRVKGESAFSLITDLSERETVAAHFMEQLVALHETPVEQLVIEGLPAPEPPSQTIARRLQLLAKKYAQVPPDPLLSFSLAWLQQNIPQDPARVVLVHGDAGPANFLYQDGEVTAVLDWEMTHYGDAMEDLAWIAIRDLFEPFVAMPFCFARYEAAGGCMVDVQKVRYYRAYALINLVVDSYVDIHWGSGEFSGVLGNNLVFSALHRRALLEGIAEFEDIILAPDSVPKAEVNSRSRSYEIALGELRANAIAKVEDRVVNGQLRALTRVIKYWQQSNVHQVAFDAQALQDISILTNQRYDSLPQANSGLCKVIAEQALGTLAIVKFLSNQVARETALVSSAMGPLADRHFAPLQ